MGKVTVTAAQVKNVFQQYAKRESAPGPSRIDYQCLQRAISAEKHLADEIAHFPNSVFAMMKEKAMGLDLPRCPERLDPLFFPKEWLETLITLLPRKEPDSIRAQDWRPIALVDCLLRGISEILRIEVLTFLRQLTDDRTPSYSSPKLINHTLESGGSCAAAIHLLRSWVEEAASSSQALVIINTDLSNAFGSVDLDTLFESLYRTFHVEPGIAAFLAYSTKYRCQTVGDLLARLVEVGVSQGRADCPQLFQLTYAVPLLAALECIQYSIMVSMWIDDGNARTLAPTPAGALEQARNWVDTYKKSVNLMNFYANPEKSTVMTFDFTKLGKNGRKMNLDRKASDWSNPITMQARGGGPRKAIPLLAKGDLGIVPSTQMVAVLGLVGVPMTAGEL